MTYLEIRAEVSQPDQKAASSSSTSDLGNNTIPCNYGREVKSDFKIKASTYGSAHPLVSSKVAPFKPPRRPSAENVTLGIFFTSTCLYY